jgi:hypothetical protein
MIHLSDAELDAVMAAAKPLAPADRSRFLEAVSARLSAYPSDEIGNGSVSRAVRDVLQELQELHWHPAAVGRVGVSKYR